MDLIRTFPAIGDSSSSRLAERWVDHPHRLARALHTFLCRTWRNNCQRRTRLDSSAHLLTHSSAEHQTAGRPRGRPLIPKNLWCSPGGICTNRRTQGRTPSELLVLTVPRDVM